MQSFKNSRYFQGLFQVSSRKRVTDRQTVLSADATSVNLHDVSFACSVSRKPAEASWTIDFSLRTFLLATGIHVELAKARVRASRDESLYSWKFLFAPPRGYAIVKGRLGNLLRQLLLPLQLLLEVIIRDFREKKARMPSLLPRTLVVIFCGCTRPWTSRSWDFRARCVSCEEPFAPFQTQLTATTKNLVCPSRGALIPKYRCRISVWPLCIHFLPFYTDLRYWNYYCKIVKATSIYSYVSINIIVGFYSLNFNISLILKSKHIIFSLIVLLYTIYNRNFVQPSHPVMLTFKQKTAVYIKSWSLHCHLSCIYFIS